MFARRYEIAIWATLCLPVRKWAAMTLRCDARVGWGIAGICPGPALPDLALRPLDILPFIAAISAGMVAHSLLLEQHWSAINERPVK